MAQCFCAYLLYKLLLLYKWSRINCFDVIIELEFMITELYLENWKSFAKATLYIDPLTFLIGTNASGKSNVLDAFMFLQRLASGISTQTAINGDMSISPLRGGVEWLIRDGENHCVLRIKVQSVTYSYIYELEFLKAESDIVITSERLLLDDAL